MLLRGGYNGKKGGNIMKISKNGQYALLALVDLVMHAEGGHESLARIAERQKIDLRFLGQIFFTLKNAGIVKSIRGKNGGYYLSTDPQSLTVADVLQITEGELSPAPCGADERAAEYCETYDACITRALWQKIARDISETLGSITIADLVESYQCGGKAV